MLTNILRWLGLSKEQKSQKNQALKPVVIPRAQHKISRADISKHALKVLYRLKDAGFQAYLVGGGVRDVLLGLHPKDFDVATDARPDQIQSLFQNCRLIGRRFRLAHVHFGPHIVEVATFRASSTDQEAPNLQLVHSKEGMILRDNIYGTLIEDVFRRDFTVNALYYNIADFTLIDYVQGLRDLKARSIRVIGDPYQRYREDPIRILRAIRFAAKLKFAIHPDTGNPIFELGGLIKQVPAPRIIDEYGKLFLMGFGESSLELLRHYQLFAILFPQTEQSLQSTSFKKFVQHALRDTDERVLGQKPVALPFLLAAFLWYPVQEEMKLVLARGCTEVQAFYEASGLVLQRQQNVVPVSKRILQGIREIWILQLRLTKRIGKRAFQVYAYPRFRAGFDFLCLRMEAGEKGIEPVVIWWKKFISANDETRLLMINAVKKESSHYKRRQKKRA